MAKLNITMLLILLLVLVSGCSQKTAQDSGPTVNSGETEQTIISKQTEMFNQLKSIGLDEFFVDINNERFLVSVIIPDDFDKNKVYYFIMGLSVRLSPKSEKVVIESYNESILLETLVIDMSDLLDLENEEITVEELRDKIQIT